MRLFFALGVSRSIYTEEIFKLLAPNALLSFAYKGLDPLLFSIARIDPSLFFGILDSGAFTAWNSGSTVDRSAYLDWALQEIGRFEEIGIPASRLRAINLDIIPGSPGISGSAHDIEQAAISSMANADFFRTQGLDVLEVFHQDEPLELLFVLIERSGESFRVAISPRNDLSVKARCEWLRWLAAHCFKRYGSKFPKCHGLAATARDMTYSFPFYSVDSATWMSPSQFGISRSVPSFKGRPSVMLNDAGGRNALQFALRASLLGFKEIERDATKLWTKRGIVFND